MRVAYSVASIVTWFLIATPAAAQNLDADNLGEAASMVSVRTAQLDEIRKYCGTQLPQFRNWIDRAAILWADNNKPELDAVAVWYSDPHKAETHEKVLASLEPMFANLRLVLKLRDAEQVCGAAAQSWTSGNSNVANETPRASGFLREYLAAHPLPAQLAERRDFLGGCVKKIVMKDGSYDAALPVCDCMHKVSLSEFTPAENAEIDRLARAGLPLSDYPPMQRAAPKLAACTE